MSDNKVFMKLGEDEEQNKDNKSQSLSKDVSKDFAIDSLMDEIKLEAVDGMVNITMPIGVLKLLQTLFKKLELNVEQEITR